MTLKNEQILSVKICLRRFLIFDLFQVAQETHHRIEQCMQFNRARAMAAVVIQKMQYEEAKLLHMNTIPMSLEEALAAQAAHKQFQHVVEVSYFKELKQNFFLILK